MSEVGDRERKVQARVIKFFKERLGYSYLGSWGDREGNSNIEIEQLVNWLERQGHNDLAIKKVLDKIERATDVSGSRTLYDANREFYGFLRYGVKIREEIGDQTETVWLVDWARPEKNEFTVAEEVAVAGIHHKRPDVVLYVNGIALGVIELKRSIVSLSEGIRQNLDSQKKEFIRPFFSTVQLVMAGNDTEGLRYGLIHTPEKFYMAWKEDSDIENPLHSALEKLCSKTRLLELVHDFIVFDAGIKKICRHHQYFGVKASQKRVQKREGGIIWHTQGSGKSLTMVWLAKWLREHVEDARVLLITDRTELDEQIEKVFLGVDEDVYRTTSGADLVKVLNSNEEWLVCSLVHKFGKSEEGNVDKFIEDIELNLPKNFSAKGDIYVFVDECHRTQSGVLHDGMKRILPDAMFIGFTGTPLLKKDQATSIEKFGPYIHTYKYDEGVSDGVVLDLRYEARDIDQSITSQERIDQWFDARTKGLNDYAKAQLKKRWGTLQAVLSAQDRLEKIVGDILLDMETRDRLKSGHGNALLVSSSIYEACKFYELFQKKGLGGKCAVVTSYQPGISDIKGEESGEGETETVFKYEVYRKMLADHFDEPEEAAVHKIERFEKDVKKRFVEQPGQMKLLIVVDKLLTGFDAPPATYLYIDKEMRDHGLFQAICRVNRLDTDDKEYGYIVDYKDLFRSLGQAVKDYTGEAFEDFDKEDVAGLLKDRLQLARERLEEILEALAALCEPVERPRTTQTYLRFFCGEGDALKENEQKRVELYRLVGSLVRAYADLANEMQEAGYSVIEAKKRKEDVEHYENLRKEVKLASGDYIDMKMYEPAMRHLLDTYIRAEESQVVSQFEDLTLVQLLVQKGESAVDDLPEGIRGSQEAVAETIENNVRKVINDERATNPKYFEKMSYLLVSLIQQRKQEALDYKAYLERITELAKQVAAPETASDYPASINTSPLRALYDNLGQVEDVAIRVDSAIRNTKKDSWRGNHFKEREVRIAIKAILGANEELVEAIFEIAKNQDEY